MRSANPNLKHCEEVYTLNPPTQRKFQEDIDYIEKDGWEPFFSYYMKYTPLFLAEYLVKNGKPFDSWDLISKHQYKTLLERYMEMEENARIPDGVVSSWVFLIMKNLAIMISFGKIYGRGTKYPHEELVGIYPDMPKNTMDALDYMDGKGMFPDKRTPYTDAANRQVYDILRQYKENMEPYEKLILVNRCLDVAHYKGKMAKYFLEGGDETADEISGK